MSFGLIVLLVIINMVTIPVVMQWGLDSITCFIIHIPRKSVNCIFAMPTGMYSPDDSRFVYRLSGLAVE